ncbi:MAG: hypothetical protein GVY36_18525 [Verrucomicrobia bacterium]|nr:hypothetical protein [Verrucomicrobiota bacterium]
MSEKNGLSTLYRPAAEAGSLRQRSLGITANMCYINLRPAISTTSAPSGKATDPGYTPALSMSYLGAARILGIHSNIWNNWQGAAHITDSGATTICYDAQHAKIEPYWKLGNDMDGGTSGDGILYDYKWRGSIDGQGVQASETTGASGSPLIITDVPNYTGNETTVADRRTSNENHH